MKKSSSPITLAIHGMGTHGEGVGYHEGYTLFVEGALPGETITTEIFETHKRYGRGKLLDIPTPSPHRVPPPCPLFGTCGGCQTMHLAYAEQLLMKQQKVRDALQRIGKIDAIDVKPCIPSPSTLKYRNKIQIPIKQEGNRLKLGLYARSSHDLVEMTHCHIHSDIGEKIYQDILPLIQNSSLTAYNPSTGKGELRHLLIKSSLYTKEALLIFVGATPPSSSLIQLAKQIKTQCPSLKGIVHNFNASPGNVILGTEYSLLEGENHIEEKICDLLFKVSPASFFQVNPLQAEALYQTVLKCAALKGKEKVLDAFCGVGTLSLILARQAKEVVGIECVPEAIQDAKVNAQYNGIHNVTFECADVTEWMTQDDQVDVVILNPPRKGCDPLFLERLKAMRPLRIVYVSCDPATLARDLTTLVSAGYRIELVQPFDMFPQTAHVETCVNLSFGFLP